MSSSASLPNVVDDGVPVDRHVPDEGLLPVQQDVPQHVGAGRALQPVAADHRRARVLSHVVQEEGRDVKRLGDPDAAEPFAETAPHAPLLCLVAGGNPPVRGPAGGETPLKMQRGRV